jgi:hypothetical protein
MDSRRDGNNVQLDRELFTMTRASSDFGRSRLLRLRRSSD